MQNSYSVIAKYYDKFTKDDCDYQQWSQYLYSVAKSYNCKRVVDIACGTGKMTQLLLKLGLQVVGVDYSEQMLQVARQKCNALLVCQDMKKLALPGKMDMAVCVNDGVNYLKQSELQNFFERVWQNLKQGSPFVFDVSSAHKLQNVVGNNVFYVDEQDQTLLWTNKLAKDSVTMSLTLFEKTSDNKYVRMEESHKQYVHQTEDLVQLLEQSGFEVIEVSQYGKNVTKNSLRVSFLAVKK